MEQQLIELFGISWYERLKDYLYTKEFLNIAQTISKERKTKTIYPEASKIFRIFKELPYDSVRVILIGLDPYPDGSACGHSFCNCKAIRPSKSLKFIMQEIESEYPELIDRFTMPLGGMDKWNLDYLIKQGVFLYNTALTVEKKVIGSHLELWKPFTYRVIQELNKSKFLVYLLLGKKAQEYSKIINPNHAIVMADHPSYHNYNPNAKFLGSRCFRQINSKLDQYGWKEIEW